MEGGWQLLNCYNPLSCADIDPIDISVAAAASARNFVIERAS